MDREAPASRGISVKTLAVASAASAAATLIVPMIWRPGTLAAAAATPIIVALVSEALNRPAERVTQVGQAVRERRTRRGADPVTETRPILEASAAEEVSAKRKRLAVITGLIAFLLVGVVWTVTELASGESLVGGKRTTYFGGSARDAKPTPTPAPGETENAPQDGAEPTPTPEATETPAREEATPEPGATPTPTPTPTPQEGGSAAPTVTPQATPTPAP